MRPLHGQIYIPPKKRFFQSVYVGPFSVLDKTEVFNNREKCSRKYNRHGQVETD